MITLFTAGYAAWRPAQLRREVERREALLVDVRLVPFTKKPGFSKGKLSARFGSRYVHVEELGNVNYQSGGIEINDLEAGLRVLAELARTRAPESLLLLCGCKDWRRCHRTPVAEAAAERLGASKPRHLDAPHRRAQMFLDL